MRKHPIQVVSRRTGLSPDLIRAWERRYGAVAPERSGTNRRLYADDDIERLRLLRLATHGGRRIGDVAELDNEELRKLVSSDEAESDPVERRSFVPRAVTGNHRELLDRCLEAIERLDGDELEGSLALAAVELTTPQLLDQILLPILRKIGEDWKAGTLRIAHEHLTTSIIRSFLGGIKNNQRAAAAAPEFVVTTPAGQSHELGALMAAVSAAADGWRVTYLGADIPADEIAAVARMREARVVGLSMVHPADDARLPAELRSIRRQLGDDIQLFVGGAAAPAYRDVLREIDARVVTDIPSLRSELEALRFAGGRD